MADNYDESTAHLGIEFFNDSKHHKRLSEEQGKPVFVDVEMVRIRYHGTREVHVAPAHAKCYAVNEMGQPSRWITYAEKYARHYKAWKENGDNAVLGTPLDEATFLTAAAKSTLRAMSIKSIEAVAAMDDQAAKTIGPMAINWRDDAKALLDSQNENAGILKMSREMDDLRAQLAELKAGKGAKPATPGADEPSKSGASSEFDAMTDAELKDYIKDKTGVRPIGNPSTSTLLKAAEEASQSIAA